MFDLSVLKRPLLLIVLAVVQNACKMPRSEIEQSGSELAEFVPYSGTEDSQEIPRGHILSQLRSINLSHDVTSIPYEAKSIHRKIVSQSGTTKLTTVSVVFPSLTEDQCRALRSAYGNLSRIKCSGNASYSLADFMPPAIQALNLSNFGDEITEKMTLQANCWSTAYEILRRNRQSYLLTLMEGVNVQKAIDANSDEVFRGDAKGASEWITKNGRFLDVILVEADRTDARLEDQGIFIGSLLHAAVIIDANGLLFEKQSIGPTEGHHFVDFPSIINRGFGRYRIVRPRHEMPSRDKLESGWRSSRVGCVEIPFVEDLAGRSKFPAWAGVKGELLKRVQVSGPCVN